MGNFSNARREAESRKKMQNFFLGKDEEASFYSQIYDRGNDAGSVDRYIKRGCQLPSVRWTKEFVQICLP
jgi:hypothetical protein